MHKSTKNKLTIAAIILAAIVVFALIVVIVINAGYRTAIGSFGYKITFDNRNYEFITSKESIDMIQIRDIEKAKCDCYIYVAEYDKAADLNQVLEVANQADGIKRPAFDDVKIGKKAYSAKHTSWTDKGGTMNMYFVAYKDHYLSVSTLSDKLHAADIDKMLKSLEITEE